MQSPVYLILLALAVVSRAENSTTYASSDLASWGGGWRAIRIMNDPDSSSVKADRNVAVVSVHHADLVGAGHKEAQLDAGKPPPTPTVPLPNWARWCLVKPCDGNKMFYMASYASHDFVSDSICNSGQWENNCDASKFTGKADNPLGRQVALDIGGNIGYYTVLLANAGWNVITVEPMPMNTQLIEATLQANPDFQGRVHLHKVGLAAKEGAQCAMISGVKNVGDGSTYCAPSKAKLDAWIGNQDQLHKAQNDPERYVLRGKFSMTTLDSMLKNEAFLFAGDKELGDIDFVKMDVEGFEGEVMKGGSSLLTQHRPSKIQSEVWNLIKKTTPSEFVNQFVKVGYSVDLHKFACDKGSTQEQVKEQLDKVFQQEKKDMVNVHMCLTQQKSIEHSLMRVEHALVRVDQHGNLQKIQ